jgi:aspartate carbamoyltransferase catalytic subunit
MTTLVAEPPRHLLDVDEWSDSDVDAVLRDASRHRDRGELQAGNLRGFRVVLLFAEPSTRTRLSFEMAARSLSAETYVVDPASSSMVKGETLVDTMRNLDALGADMIVLRHHRAGAPWVAARYFGGSIVNSGDGWHAHPTQALLDLLTLRRALAEPGLDPADALRGRKIAIVGDLLHSRVARSNVWTLTRAGVDLWLCGPKSWLRGFEALPVTLTSGLDAALRDADAVIGLRVQRERMAGGALSLDEYVDQYQITEPSLARAAPNAFYLHPGPINEGVEVTREVARGPRSLVLEQVANGLAVRISVLAMLAPSAPRGLRGPRRDFSPVAR